MTIIVKRIRGNARICKTVCIWQSIIYTCVVLVMACMTVNFVGQFYFYILTSIFRTYFIYLLFKYQIKYFDYRYRLHQVTIISNLKCLLTHESWNTGDFNISELRYKCFSTLMLTYRLRCIECYYDLWSFYERIQHSIHLWINVRF